jgi:hypothetical protein
LWLFVPEPLSPSAPDTAASSAPSLALAPEFVLWVLLSGKPTPLPSSQIEWSKATWLHVLSGTIWDPLTANRSAIAWISSLPVSPARVLASPVDDSAPMTNDGSGRSSGEPRSTSEPAGCSSRTSQVCCPLTTVEHSRRSSGIWHRAGGLRNGTAYPRQPSVPRTSEIVSSCSLPTPTASSYGSSQNGSNSDRPSAGTLSLAARVARGIPVLPTPRASDATKGSRSTPERPGKQGPTLREALGRSRLPTPVARDHKGVGRDGQLPTEIERLRSRGLLPTPTAQDARAGGPAGNWTPESGRHAGATLTDVVVRGVDTPSRR